MVDLQKARDDQKSDECIALLMAFMQISDRKSRAEVVKFAERCAQFGSGGIVSFGNERR